MICFRCGSEVAEGAPQCSNCGQRFAGARRTFTATTTSFRALEKRRQRAQKASEKLPYGIGDVVLARYEIRDLIGSGPLGVVYRAFDQELDLDLALKVFHPGLAAGEQGRETFQATIRKVRKLSQQNIVRLYDDAVDGDRVVVTMQLLEGLTLRKVIGLRQDKGQRFQVKEIEPIVFQVAMALSHAHRHSVHGDMKPENVLIMPDVLKITDFAVHEAVGREAFVQAQVEAGFSGYFAPEVLSGGVVDARSDLYSLGAIFYELVTGQAFAPGAPPPSRVLEQPDESTTEGVDAFVAKATAEKPENRFSTAEAFIEALATYIDGRELRSVDLRARPLLPEDVTRRVQAPAGLQDDDSVDVPFVPATTRARALAGAASAAPESEAERSFVEELGDDDFEVERSMDASLDRSVEIAEESVDRPKPTPVGPAFGEAPELPTKPWEPVVPRTVTTTAPRPPATPTAAASGPWFLRSNVGFVAAVVAIVLAIAGGAWFLRGRLSQDRNDVPVRQQVVKVGAELVPPTSPPPVRVAAQPVTSPTPVTAAVAMMTPSESPSAKPAPVAAVVAPTPRPSPNAPATRAAAAPPPTAAPPPPRTAPPTAAPVVSKPPPSAAPAVAVAKPAAATNEKTSCPSGTLLIATGNFPKGSVKGRDVIGAEAVAMARSGKAYCVDAHEYPGNGRTPKVNVTFDGAAGLCKAAGKRLCADSEWQRACGGGFPYGKSFDAGRCNTEDADGEARSLSEAGRFPRCRSAYGAYDMSGNAAEWTSDQTVRGGDYTSADDDAACGAGGKRAAGSARPSIGFRCCADLP